MLLRAPSFREPDRTHVENASNQILNISNQLYVQGMMMFELMHQLISHIPLYFSQRQPHELGSFTWVIDGKERTKVTKWEMWWSWYARGALASMSKNRPTPMMEGADYSHYKKFSGHSRGEEGTDLKLLLADLQFVSAPKAGLELIDIIVNATRRALMGSLNVDGWRSIPHLMIHRKEPYIKLIAIKEGDDVLHRTAYANIMKTHFSSGGRLMVAPRFIRQYQNELKTSKSL